ncbi:MAG TPA: hypothetical protein VHE55_11240 [Fimbriimonadaceae bacterium]|nr:hypothetical protein [Fimbriimonadaceae bacterium]
MEPLSKRDRSQVRGRSSARARRRIAGLCALLAGLACPAEAQTIDPYYAGSYSSLVLGSVPGVPVDYGGLCFKYDDPNTLLIAGAACGPSATVYRIGVARDSNHHITGFAGSAEPYSEAPYIDGGLNFGPGNVLFAPQYFSSNLMETKVGSSQPDRIVGLGAGFTSGNPSGCAFVPSGFWNAGRLKISTYSYDGGFYDMELSPDGHGTYDVVNLTRSATMTGFEEGFGYVPFGAPLFPNPSMLVCEVNNNAVWSWEVDQSGDPIAGTQHNFMTLPSAEGAIVDPLTGDFLFSSYNYPPHQVVRVSANAVPEPTPLAVLGIAALLGLRRKTAPSRPTPAR